MPENEKYIQGKLPTYGKRRVSSQFAAVFVNEERRETNRQLQMLSDTKTVEVKKIIPMKNILYYDNENYNHQQTIVVKLNEPESEKITTFSFFPEPARKEDDRRNHNNLLWWPSYLVANRWLEEPNIKFPPWSLGNLRIMDEGGFYTDKLNEVNIDEIGGKAHGLIKLKKYEKFGFKIPDFIVIPTSFYKKMDAFGFSGRAEKIMESFASPEDIMRQDELHDGVSIMSTRNVPHEIEKLFDSLNFERSIYYPTLAKDICQFAGITDYWGTPGRKVILRSSSPLEDSQKTEYQFQGVFESQTPTITSLDDIYDSLKSVYLSPWSAYAEFYLRNRHLVGKIDRNMAVIVQEVPKDYKFVCRVFYNNGKVAIEYISRDLFYGSQFVGLKAIINSKGEIIKNEDEVEDHYYKDIFKNRKMSNEEIVKIASIMQRLSEVPEYGVDFNTEILAGGELPYIVQIRRAPETHKTSVVSDIDEVDRESVIVDFTAETNNFSIGKIEGPVVNLMGYFKGHVWEKDETGHEKGRYVYGDLNEYYEKAEYYNKKYPGAIFIVDMDFGDQEILGEKFHMLTSKKGGLITCHRYDTSLRCPHFLAELYKDPCFHVVNVLPEPFKDMETGTPMGVISNGDKARFYHPKNYSGPTIVFSQPKACSREKQIYSQGVLFDASTIKGEIIKNIL